VASSMFDLQCCILVTWYRQHYSELLSIVELPLHPSGFWLLGCAVVPVSSLVFAFDTLCDSYYRSVPFSSLDTLVFL
jgi:hypothetical protein